MRPLASRFVRTALQGDLCFYSLCMQDLSFRVGDITPPFLGKPPHQVAQLCSQMFLPLDLKAADRQFLLAIRHGTIHDKQALMALLDGTLQKQAHDLSAAATVPGDHVTQRLNADKPLQP